MRSGSLWPYLVFCALVLTCAHAEVLPTGEQVASAYVQALEYLQGKPNPGPVETPSNWAYGTVAKF